MKLGPVLEAKKHKLIKSSILIERTSNFGNVTFKEGNKTISLQGESWRLERLYCHHDVERYDISEKSSRLWKRLAKGLCVTRDKG